MWWLLSSVDAENQDMSQEMDQHAHTRTLNAHSVQKHTIIWHVNLNMILFDYISLIMLYTIPL